MQSGGLCSLCKNDLGQVTSPPQAPGRSSATQQRSCHPMRAGGVNDICKAEAGPRGGPRYWEREEPKRPRPPGRRMQRTPHSQPNPQSQRRTPGSGWEAGCPDFACLLGREQPGPVRMERGKQMKSYIDRGQGAHHRSLGVRRRGRRMGPGREPGLDIFRVQQARVLPAPGKCVRSSEHCAGFRLLPAHAQQRTWEPVPAQHPNPSRGPTHCPS